MARIRTIKPEFWTDSVMVQLPPLARLLFIALWNAADDHGNLPDEPERIAMETLPREDAVLVSGLLDLLVAVGRVERLTDGTETWLRVTNWAKHQRVDHPGKSKYPREASRKLPLVSAVRREVADKYGCPQDPGDDGHPVTCFYCGAEGRIYRSKSWVYLGGVEFDHFLAERHGGPGQGHNIVLACRSCNRAKRDGDPIQFATSLAKVREGSRGLAPDLVPSTVVPSTDDDSVSPVEAPPDRSSSSYATAKEAQQIIVDRLLERTEQRGIPVLNPAAYRQGVAGNVWREHGQRIVELVTEGFAADVVAERVLDTGFADPKCGPPLRYRRAQSVVDAESWTNARWRIGMGHDEIVFEASGQFEVGSEEHDAAMAELARLERTETRSE